ncbi:hypothetical protein [Clostridium sp. CCUG 7971]|uniref:hypothetical protein n=1 Tax=Clostridium sp. CCUG 7971 TaxID=2811414 RepID=UPI001ABAFDF5|nr:hypothetical protein [Clostridium sp. CCUG 7971]MBO3445420.1 hypothetical protein [Clostridium sp. CCUG 7971]
MIKRILNASKKQKIIGLLVIITTLVGILTIVTQAYKDKNKGMISSETESNVLEVPSINLIPPNKIDVNNKEEFDVDVVLSSLPSNIYPAASISIYFDKDKLEFTRVKKGTMQAYGDKSSNGKDFSVPYWEYDTEASNMNGQINTMYLDKTAGRFAYNKDGFDNKSKNVVIRLGFKLKEGVKPGETYPLNIKDVVFATINGDKDNTSLSSSRNTLKINDCELVVQD